MTFGETIAKMAECYAHLEEPQERVRRDCFHYSEDQDFHAIIPMCRFAESFGDFACDGCEKYISKADALKVILDYQNIQR